MIKKVLTSVLWLSTLGALGALPAAAAELPVKSLAGPPSEFAAHRLPSAKDTLVSSNILLVDRPQDGKSSVALPPGITSTDFSASPGVGFSVIQGTTLYPYFAPTTFTGPNGARYSFDGYSISCNWGACGSSSAYLQMEPFSGSAGGVAVFSISGGEVTAGGTWNLTVTAPGGGPLPLGGKPPAVNGVPQIETLIAFDDNVVEVGTEPQPCQSASIILPPQPCPELPRGSNFDLVDGAAPVLRLSFVNRAMKSQGLESSLGLEALKLTVTDARTRLKIHEEQLSLSRLAGLPVDHSGANLVQLPALPAGEYSIRFDVRGNVPGIGPIERTALYFLPILPRGYALTGEARTALIDADRLELQLQIDAPTAARPHVHAYAEVWSGEGEKAVAWIGGMTQPKVDGRGSLYLPLVLDSRWLALAGVRGSRLELRNLRIQDADTFIPLSQLAKLAVEAGELPRSASLAAAEIVADESLYMGRADRSVTVADSAATSAPDPLTFSDTGIFLIHGWCSDAVWPVGDFGRPGRVGGTEVFSDFNASRSHDAFAQRIRDQGSANFSNSFTVAAHSQGGAAATHLRSFYWSLLDVNNGAPRRIQTVGTPYLGSTLMDLYLATAPLSNLILGMLGQCPIQSFDLSTLGSALWQVTLPSGVRGEVFYYRTGYRRPRTFWDRLQFWRWHCGLGSFVIPSWDDGVVADLQGLLPGGRNMGITESECHTGTANNQTPQTFNIGRNDVIDREGRPQSLNQARTATATASSTYTPGCSPGPDCYSPARVNDGDRSTALGGNTSWVNNYGTPIPGSWVQLTWPTPITFSRVEIYLTSGYELSRFQIQWRSSATAPWQDVVAVNGNNSNYRGPFTVPGGSATAQAIRVFPNSGSATQPGYARVNELEVY